VADNNKCQQNITSNTAFIAKQNRTNIISHNFSRATMNIRAPTISPVQNYSVPKQSVHREKLTTQQNVTILLFPVLRFPQTQLNKCIIFFLKTLVFL